MSQTCCCPHPDRYECFILRYSTGMRSREEVEEEARLNGGCECGCHHDYDEYDDYDPLPYVPEIPGGIL